MEDKINGAFYVGSLVTINLTKQKGYVTALMTDGKQTKQCVKHTNKDGDFQETWFLDWEISIAKE